MHYSSSFFSIFAFFLEKYSNKTEVEVLECTKGFYQENISSVCQPSCYTWIEYSEGLSIFSDVVVFISAFMGFVAAIAVIILSCLRHKKM